VASRDTDFWSTQPMILSLVGLAILFLICFLGVPLGYGMLIIGTVGFAYLRGPVPAMEIAGSRSLICR
jgi:hypothetical protein